MKTKTVKVCLYKLSHDTDVEIVAQFYDYTHWIQLSHPIEVTFNLLEPEIIILNEVALIDKQLNEIQEEALRKMERLKEKRAELLALSAPKSEEN